MKILLIDNYDSFTYNLVQFLGEVSGSQALVRRNDQIRIEEVSEIQPTHIVISPGPCTPREAGVSIELIKCYKAEYPILGVCLGHQAIGAAFGAEIVRGCEPVHGKTTLVTHDGLGIFSEIPQKFIATRYHSLVIKPASLPSELVPTAWSEDRQIMGIRHKIYPRVEGLQFHPESILTTVGKDLLRNFLLPKNL